MPLKKIACIFYFCGLTGFFLPLWGQGVAVVSGRIVDKETSRPLEGVSVLLFSGNQKAASTYALSDVDGNYKLNLKPQYGDSLRIEASMLSYAKQNFVVKNETRTLNISMTPQATNLKEVVVRANKLWKERDTLNYDVNLFKTGQDRVIGDVLKKLPGIEVAQSGAISYNGKAINKFYVEGSDLLDGRYGLATKNIPADAVKKVQVLENHQAIKALEKSEFSDQAAINLVLKDGAKSRWLGKIDAGFGADFDTPSFLWDGRAMAMRVGRGLQSINVYKTNNIGNNVTDELMNHTFRLSSWMNESSAEQSDWLSVVMPATPPVSENRYLFNQSHLLSTNNVLKLNDIYQLRANVSYLNDKRDFDTEARTVYYLESDSTLTISEMQESTRKQHQLEAGFTLTANSPDYYLQNNLNLRSRWNKTNANTWNGVNTIGQQLSTPNHNFSNDFQWIKNKGLHTFQVTSYNSYALLPQELQIDGVNYADFQNSSDSSLVQRLRSTSFFSNTNATFKTKRKNWRMELKAGFQAQLQHIDSEIGSSVSQMGSNVIDSLSNDFSYSKFRCLVQPQIGYQGRQLRFTLALPVSYNSINDENFALFSPAFSVNYDMTAYWNMTGSASYGKNFGDIRTMVPNYILYNYRSIERNPGDLLEQAQQSYRLGLTYRNPVTAFFASISGNYSKNVANLLYDRSFYGMLSERTAVLQDNDRQTWSASARVSKTIDAWNTTFWLDAGYSYITAEQLSQNQWTRYASEAVNLRPKVLVKPARWTNVEYEASFARSQLKILKPQASQSEPVFAMSHFLTWNLNLTREFQAYLRGEYYYNQAAGISYPAVFFADAGVRYVWRQFEFAVDARNIFNNKRYEYSLLGTLSESFSAYKLRPASVVAKVSWAF